MTALPLSGQAGWAITDGKAGMAIQVEGIAAALGLDCRTITVTPRLPWRLMAPWGPPDPHDRPGAPGSQMAPPYPAVALATGRLSIPYLRDLRRRAGARTLTVVVQDPRTGAGTADVVAVPAHDALTGPNVIRTLTAPHAFSPLRLAALRASPPPEISALTSPRVAVMLGGPNAVYRYGAETAARLERSLASLVACGASLMITPSRRTPPEVVAASVRACAGNPFLLWEGRGANPYAQYLASADALVVTADSVNMTGEACATGKPVWVFEPEGGSAKFNRFHDALRRYGATMPLPAAFGQLESWTYAPLDSAALIAREIERRWLARQRREKPEINR
ncbi:MAG: mitochondrial fission ELM1 family protein [Pseudomonadota bacterium]|nr:mitochondrial fission ELM1 family protein [Pseudomonadota bacterium]